MTNFSLLDLMELKNAIENIKDEHTVKALQLLEKWCDEITKRINE